MKKIFHKSFTNGNAQSIGIELENGKTLVSGIALPGKHDFGKAKNKKLIFALYGEFILDGRKYAGVNSPISFEAGESIIIKCLKPVSYIITAIKWFSIQPQSQTRGCGIFLALTKKF